MNKQRLITIAILLFASSCSPFRYRYIYTASPANNPYFTEKGNSKIAGYYSDNSGGGEDQANGFDLQAGYAISNHIGIIASYYKRKEDDEEGNSRSGFSIVNYKRDFADAGIGYFRPINKKKTIFFNFYGGYGMGKFSIIDNPYDYENKFNKLFFQQAINFMPGKYVRFSFSAKFSYVRFKEMKTSYSMYQIAGFGLNQISNNTLFFFEPSISLQFGIPSIPWVRVEGITSGITNYHPYNDHAAIRDGNSSIGLYFDFSKMKRKK